MTFCETITIESPTEDESDLEVVDIELDQVSDSLDIEVTVYVENVIIEGSGETLSGVVEAVPVINGVTSPIDIIVSQLQPGEILDYTGFIDVPEEGDYEVCAAVVEVT